MTAICWIIIFTIIIGGRPIDLGSPRMAIRFQEEAAREVSRLVKMYRALEPHITIQTVGLEPTECPTKNSELEEGEEE